MPLLQPAQACNNSDLRPAQCASMCTKTCANQVQMLAAHHALVRVPQCTQGQGCMHVRALGICSTVIEQRSQLADIPELIHPTELHPVQGPPSTAGPWTRSTLHYRTSPVSWRGRLRRQRTENDRQQPHAEHRCITRRQSAVPSQRLCDHAAPYSAPAVAHLLCAQPSLQQLEPA